MKESRPPEWVTIVLLVIAGFLVLVALSMQPGCSEQGPQGDKGERGLRGEQGPPGIDGTPLYVFLVEASDEERADAWCPADSTPLPGGCEAEVSYLIADAPQFDETGEWVGWRCASAGAGDTVHVWAACESVEPPPGE